MADKSSSSNESLTDPTTIRQLHDRLFDLQSTLHTPIRTTTSVHRPPTAPLTPQPRFAPPSEPQQLTCVTMSPLPAFHAALARTRLLSTFEDPFLFLEHIARMVGTYHIPESEFGRFLLAVLEADKNSDRLVRFVENLYPLPGSKESPPSPQDVQIALLQRLEGGNTSFSLTKRLMALRPPPDCTIADFFDEFSRLSNRIPNAEALDLPSIFAEALPPAAKQAFNSSRAYASEAPLAELVRKTNIALGNAPLVTSPSPTKLAAVTTHQPFPLPVAAYPPQQMPTLAPPPPEHQHAPYWYSPAPPYPTTPHPTHYYPPPFYYPPPHFPAPMPTPAPPPEVPSPRATSLLAPTFAHRKKTAEQQAAYDERMRRGVCTACGIAGHFRASCPTRAHRPQVQTTKQHDSYPVAVVEAEVLSLTSGRCEKVAMLADSGADDVFISESLATRLDCARHPVEHVIDTATTQKRLTVSEGTTLSIKWRHTVVQMNFLIVPDLSYDLICGTGYLRAVLAAIVYPEIGDPQAFPTLSLSAGVAARLFLAARDGTLDENTPDLPLEMRGSKLSSLTHTAERIERLSAHPFRKRAPLPGSELLRLLPKEYQDLAEAFDESKTERLPPSRTADMEIRLVDETASPPDSRMYRLCNSEQNALREWIGDCLRKGHIRPSKSPAGAGVFFVSKKDGTLRLCIDYRLLNAMTIANNFPLPLTDALLDRIFLAKPTILTKIDLKSAFNLLQIREADRWKTAFKCPFGHFEMQVVPFGLKNAPATWQAFIESIFPDSFRAFMVVYIDDILIYSRTPEEHTRHVREVLNVLIKHDLVASIKKCNFSVTSTDFLGFIVSTNGISMDPRKTDAIRTWQPPRTPKGVMGFMGLCNFYRRFIPNLSNIATALYDACKSKPFALSVQALNSFNDIKGAFARSLSLAHPDFAKPFFIFGDASSYGLGAGLHQLTGTIDPTDFSLPPTEYLVPISFFSRKLLPAELNYDTGDKELLVIKESLEFWRPWLRGSPHPTRFFSDHKNLQHFSTTSKLSARVMRWQTTFNDFDFRVIFLPGTSMTAADALSRKGEFRPTSEEIERLRSAPPLSPQRCIVLNLISTHTQHPPEHRDDPPTPSVLNAITRSASAAAAASPPDAPSATPLPIISTEEAPPSSPLENAIPADNLSCFRVDHLWDTMRKESTAVEKSPAGFRMADGLLINNARQTYVPSLQTRMTILHFRHSHPAFGHLGVAKTVDAVLRDFWWPGLRKDAKMLVGRCEPCQRGKTSRAPPSGLLQPLPVAEHPWKHIEMDHITDLPRCASFDAILTVTDRFTKMVRFVPAHTTDTAKDLASLYLHHIFRSFGRPDTIVSDRGSLFVSTFWTELCRLLGIELRHSSGHHAQTAGQSERHNQTIEHVLRCSLLQFQSDWLDLLPMAEFAINSSTSASTNVTPFYALYGYTPTFDLPAQPASASSSTPAVEGTTQRWATIKATLERTIAEYKTQADRHRSPAPTYQIGDLVLLRNANLPSSVPRHKLNARFIGPFPITRVLSPTAVILDLPKNWRLHPTFHVSCIKPFKQPLVPSPPPPPELIDGHLYFVVKKIIARRKYRGQEQFLVTWEGHPDQENRWLPRSELTGCRSALKKFLREQASAKSGAKS